MNLPKSAHNILATANYNVQMEDLVTNFPDKFNKDDLDLYSLKDRLKINAIYESAVDNHRDEMEEIQRWVNLGSKFSMKIIS